ncbi:MAG: radical SAM family heme chaperone HemW [Armatimonadetes bacterium]|nr:radical SAM family heme chaperone HemW [Armatimonadota bacterium]
MPQDITPSEGRSAGLYVHFPFCLRKCPYCDFNSKVAGPRERDEYIEALRREVAPAGPDWDGVIFSTVYFGGGTPTLYSPRILVDLLDLLRRTFTIAPGAEVTIEANPKTVDIPGLRYLSLNGFNRISLGIQSLDDDDLRFLGRIHSSADGLAAFHSARAAGFRNINIDLLRGLPGHTPEKWRDLLQRTVALIPEHVSCYALTLEPGTRLFELHQRGDFKMPDEQTSLELLEVTDEVLSSAGLQRYEVSNWAQPGRECRHNMNYWLDGDYLGLGAGAWSHRKGHRWGNVAEPPAYIARLFSRSSPVEEAEHLPAEKKLFERAMIGLRLVQGVRWADLVAGAPEEAVARLRRALHALAQDGLVWFNNGQVGPTPRGLVLLNQAALRLMEELS